MSVGDCSLIRITTGLFDLSMGSRPALTVFVCLIVARLSVLGILNKNNLLKKIGLALIDRVRVGYFFSVRSRINVKFYSF